jgi:hypothetical protein
MTLRDIMTEDGMLQNVNCVPAELQHDLPRRIRLAARGVYYLLGSMAISILMIAFIVVDFSKTAKEVRNGAELARDGIVAYTGDVQAGGMHLATACYSFTWNGTLYRGKARLPSRYLDKIDDYSKSDNFPVLFLPRDPSINHPNDWRDDESYSSAFISYVLIVLVVIQWSVLFRAILQELRLARNGVVATGRVTSWSYGRSGGIYVKYEFRDMDDLLSVGRGECPGWRKQDEQICVLYLPDQPDKNRPYPLVFFRVH